MGGAFEAQRFHGIMQQTCKIRFTDGQNQSCMTALLEHTSISIMATHIIGIPSVAVVRLSRL